MSIYDVTIPIISGITIFTMKGAVTPIEVDVEGVLEVSIEESGAVIVKNGEVIRGVRFVDSEGEPADLVVEGNCSQFIMLMVMAEEGGGVTVTHEDLGVSEPSERISVSDGAATAIDVKMVQIFGMPWLDRVRVNDWAGV